MYMGQIQTIETYKTFRICRDPEYGYFWRHGGYYETIEDCRTYVDSYQYEQELIEQMERAEYGEEEL